ncbi:MAG TPA: CYTH domain-containing protein [Devosia sp.]|nr:CYTH domain-containing protein [Devosia sp.]
MSGRDRREIERKFLVTGEGWRKKAGGPSRLEQGYLARGRRATVRVRIKDGKAATLTIKSRERGANRAEFEYRIGVRDARALLELCGSSRIEKQRYTISQGKLNWEVDVFGGRHEGLVLAEVELPSSDTPVELPNWIGEEVTSDPRYRNSALADFG